jgi:hypothetical protein
MKQHEFRSSPTAACCDWDLDDNNCSQLTPDLKLEAQCAQELQQKNQKVPSATLSTYCRYSKEAFNHISTQQLLNWLLHEIANPRDKDFFDVVLEQELGYGPD